MNKTLEAITQCIAIDLRSHQGLGSPFHSPFVTSVFLVGALRFGSSISDDDVSWFKELIYKSGDNSSGWCFFPDGGGYPPDTDTTAAVIIARALMNDLKDRDEAELIDLLERNRDGGDSFFIWFKENGIRKNEDSDPFVNANASVALHLLRKRNTLRDSASNCSLITRSQCSAFYRTEQFSQFMVDNLIWALGSRKRGEMSCWPKTMGILFQHSKRPVAYTLASEVSE